MCEISLYVSLGYVRFAAISSLKLSQYLFFTHYIATCNGKLLAKLPVCLNMLGDKLTL